MDGEEVGARILGFQWFEELVEGRVEAYRRSNTLWLVHYQADAPLQDRVELELDSFLQTPFDSLLEMERRICHLW